MKSPVSAALMWFAVSLSCSAQEPKAVLVRDGTPAMPIVLGSDREPGEILRTFLKRITGAELEFAEPREGKLGLHVGLAKDFPWFKIANAEPLGAEGYVLKTMADGSVYIVANEKAGLHHGVHAFLHSLGCRWFFPDPIWESIPGTKTIRGSWDDRQSPAFAVQRKIWYGFGSYPIPGKDFKAWEQRNRMGGPIAVTIGHTWHGLDPKKDFADHPEWFSEIKGKRQPIKPCYSHPGMIARACEYAVAQADKGVSMISMSPPDGLGFCECERCRKVFQGAEAYAAQGTLFAKRPDGVVVNITSETLFAMVNEVAAAVAKKYPKTLVGCYAYSAYSHPPSFKVHPNVFLQTTTAFRRTPMTLPEQLETFRKLGAQSGIRGYYSVFQWDGDMPAIAKGEMSLPRMVDDLRFYQKQNVQSVNAEASCNWGPRGLGYYLASRFMWNPNEDPKTILADFYDRAYGPAAAPMERWHVRWFGAGAAVRTRPTGTTSGKETDSPKDEVNPEAPALAETFDAATLREAYRDLDEAIRRTADSPEHRARVDRMRMYAHFLRLVLARQEAGKTKDREKIVAAIRDEATWASRLTDTGLVHSRPLIGKEFYRRYKAYQQYLVGEPEWPESTADAVAAAAGKGCRVLRHDIPTAVELDSVWANDRKALSLR
jgi:hypothetical protein